MMDWSSKLLDGKRVSLAIQEELKAEVERRVAAGLKRPHLAAILVGNDGGSETYVNAKIRTCEAIGYDSTLIRESDTISEDALLQLIAEVNADTDIDGLIVQLPLPKHISVDRVLQAIDPKKDVDGFHPQNAGRLVLGLPTYVSATPWGILELLRFYEINTTGKHCVVIGRSHIVGTPVSILMSRNAEPGNATVTLCHSKTQDLKSITQTADIIIAALGIPEFLTGDMVKEGAIVIDVGTTRVPDATTKSGWRLKGDVNFNQVAPKAAYITPVPGGVGPMTIAGLMYNTMKAANKAVYP